MLLNDFDGTRVEASTSSEKTPVSMGPSTFIISSWYKWQIGDFNHLTSNNNTYQNFLDGLQEYVLPLNMRLIPLDTGITGWRDHANTTSTDIQNKTVIHEFLRATDALGISVAFTIPLNGYRPTGWHDDVVNAYPETQTYNISGQPVEIDGRKHLSVDCEKILLDQYKEDLKQLWSYYSEYDCWVGFAGWDYSDGPAYARIDGGLTEGTWGSGGWGLANYTLQNFTNTEFFDYDVDGTGYHSDGTKCKLYEMFVEETQEYNTSTLVDDILDYHKFKWTVDPSHGFTNYLNYEYAKILHDALEWFDGYTGKNWVFIDGSTGLPWYHLQRWGFLDKFHPSHKLANPVGNEYPGPSPPPQPPTMYGVAWKPFETFYSPNTRLFYTVGNPYHNGGGITPEQIRSIYLYAFLFHQGIWGIDCIMNETKYDGWLGLVNLTQQKHSRTFGEILSRMRRYDDYYYFGLEKGALNVLMIGENEIGNILHYLSPALNITLCGGEYINGNVTQFGDFSQFDVIVWLSGRPSPSGNVLERIKNFVNNGGGYVETDSSWDDTLNPVLGFDHTGQSISSSTTKDYINMSSEIMKPWSGISNYVAWGTGWIAREMVPDSGNPGTVVVNSTNGNPWIAVNEYGNGRGVLCARTSALNEIGNPPAIGDYDKKFGCPRDDYIVLLTNAILYAGKKENLITIWYYSTTYNKEYPWNGQLQYVIYGNPGKPILLWLTNNGTETSFEIHLNATFYNLNPNGWIAMNVVDWQVIAKGNGTDVHINTTVPAKSWKPIYIMNTTSNLQDVYSNTFFESKSITTAKASYDLQAPYNQTSWLILNSTTPPSNVYANNTGNLPQHTSLTTLNKTTTKNGWHHDPTNKLLYIKLKTTSPAKTTITLPHQYITLKDYTHPFTAPNNKLNHTIIIPSSTPHAPCGAAHTMDVVGAVLVGQKLGLSAGDGIPASTMDDYITTYNPTTGTITIHDTTNNLITVGGPGVNTVTKYYNDLLDSENNRVLPVYFLKDNPTTDYIYVETTGHTYYIGYDEQDRKIADYALIELYHDQANGRIVLIVAGLGGEGTWAACKVLSTYQEWDLTGMAAIIKYYDSDSDGYLDRIVITEIVENPSTQQITTSTLSTESLHVKPPQTEKPSSTHPALLPIGLISLIPLTPIIKRKKFKTKKYIAAAILTTTILTATNQLFVKAQTQPTLSNYPQPFTSSNNILNSTIIVASSTPHAPCGGAHTMDVMGAVLVGQKLGLSAEGGIPASTMDDYISSYDSNSCLISLLDTTHNLISFGGPGVNTITKYYNDLQNDTGNHVLSAYILKNSSGADYIYAESTGNTYYIEYDAQDRKTADYAIIHLYHDESHGRWILIIAGLGGEGTLAASKVLSTCEDWGLTGVAAIIKYYDSNDDGYLDEIAIAETVG